MIKIGIVTLNFNAIIPKSIKKSQQKIYYEKRLERLCQLLQSLTSKHEIDIINLQEITHRYLSTSEITTMLLKSININGKYFSSIGPVPRSSPYDPGCLYLMTLYNISKFYLLGTKNINLNNFDENWNCNSLFFDFKIIIDKKVTNYKFLNCNVHQPWRDNKIIAIKRLFENLKSYEDSGYFVFVSGDFNTIGHQESSKELLSIMSANYNLNAKVYQEKDELFYYYENMAKNKKIFSTFIGINLSDGGINAELMSNPDVKIALLNGDGPKLYNEWRKKIQPIDWFLSLKNVKWIKSREIETETSATIDTDTDTIVNVDKTINQLNKLKETETETTTTIVSDLNTIVNIDKNVNQLNKLKETETETKRKTETKETKTDTDIETNTIANMIINVNQFTIPFNELSEFGVNINTDIKEEELLSDHIPLITILEIKFTK